jgi:diaminohydroxyphosphoribosylaminopyrimidine deaminase/5-amino-6-(5-phosphoribosylamino)uracil reductase
MPDPTPQQCIQAVHASGRPWIIGKAAMSRNGKMTRPIGQGQWISGEDSRHDVQHLRARCDAILVGARTARRDNPKLTIRDFKVPRQPWRVVLTSSGNIPKHLHLFKDENNDRTLIIGKIAWADLWKLLFRRGIRTLLVEGGGNILNQLAEANFIDESIIYYAPFQLEGEKLVTAETFRGLELASPEITTLGEDSKISGLVLK